MDKMTISSRLVSDAHLQPAVVLHPASRSKIDRLVAGCIVAQLASGSDVLEEWQLAKGLYGTEHARDLLRSIGSALEHVLRYAMAVRSRTLAEAAYKRSMFNPYSFSNVGMDGSVHSGGDYVLHDFVEGADGDEIAREKHKMLAIRWLRGALEASLEERPTRKGSEDRKRKAKATDQDENEDRVDLVLDFSWLDFLCDIDEDDDMEFGTCRSAERLASRVLVALIHMIRRLQLTVARSLIPVSGGLRKRASVHGATSHSTAFPLPVSRHHSLSTLPSLPLASLPKTQGVETNANGMGGITASGFETASFGENENRPVSFTQWRVNAKARI